MTRSARILMLVLLAVLARVSVAEEQVVVGSKNFTEGVVVGDLAALVLESDGIAATHRRSLGGTRVLFEALRNGQIDAYGDYTGTLSQELVPGTPPEVPALRAALAPLGLGITDSLGFNDTYAIAVRRDLAEARGIRTISDLRDHPGDRREADIPAQRPKSGVEPEKGRQPRAGDDVQVGAVDDQLVGAAFDEPAGLLEEAVGRPAVDATVGSIHVDVVVRLDGYQFHRRDSK